MESSLIKVRPPLEGEEFNLENGYIVADGDQVEAFAEKMAEVLDSHGLEVIKIEAGWSELVLKIQKKS